MASGYVRLLGRSAVRSTVAKPFPARSAAPSSSFHRSPLPAKSPASPLRRSSSFFSSPSELGCMQSLLPLHSAVAASRMTSHLSSAAKSYHALSQELGLSFPR